MRDAMNGQDLDERNITVHGSGGGGHSGGGGYGAGGGVYGGGGGRDHRGGDLTVQLLLSQLFA